MNLVTLSEIVPQRVLDQPATSKSQRDFAHLFETLVSDLQWAALHAGILTAVIGTKLRTDPAWDLRPWRHLLNTDTRVASLGLRYALEMQLNDECAYSAVQFYSTFSDAITMSLPVFSESQAHCQKRRSLQPMLRRWQDVCLLAGKALSDFAPVVRLRLHNCYNVNNESVIAFIEAASREINNLVNPNGEIASPTLTQRRRAVRGSTRKACVVVHSNGKVPAEVTDVSRTGIGLNCKQQLPNERPVTIELVDGRQLQANIIWQQNGRIGLEFLFPLGCNDLLLPAI